MYTYMCCGYIVAQAVMAMHNLNLDGATLTVQKATGYECDSVASGNVNQNEGRNMKLT